MLGGSEEEGFGHRNFESMMNVEMEGMEVVSSLGVEINPR